METLIGFAVGYLVGTQHGREGLAKVREAWGAVSTSPEVRQALVAGASMAGETIRKVLDGGVLRGVVEQFVPKSTEQKAA